MTALLAAERWMGTHELPGSEHNPLIVGMLQAAGVNVHDDETAWCSAFAYHIAWQLDLPRPMTAKARARSWLLVGTAVELEDAVPGFTVAILARGGGHQPGPHVLDAPGHVAFLKGVRRDPAGKVVEVIVCGGNQGDAASGGAVTVAPFPAARVLGIREL